MNKELKNTFTIIYEFGDFRLIPTERILELDGKTLSLPPKVFDTLIILVENHGHLIEKDEFLENVWGETFVEEGTLARTISRLRKTLGKEHTYIETIAKSGYRFVEHVTVIEKPQNNNAGEIKSNFSKNDSKEQVDPTRIYSQKWYRRPSVLFIGTIVLISLIALTFIWRADFYGNRNTRSIKTIAVLPFKILGNDETDRALEVAMADALITKLGNFEKIVVLPTSAIYRYAEKDNFIPKNIGRELNVDAVLDGTLQKDGERLRVSVQLINVVEGNSLWSDKFDSEDKDIFVLQDNISEQVANALELKLSGKEKNELTKRYTENREAYEAYIKGRYLWSRRNPADFKGSLELFEKAIEIDPNYALAYTGVADCYQLFAEYNLLPINEGFAKARSAARKALEIDDSLAEAHSSLAYTLAFYDWDFVVAEKEFKRAIELNPNYATAYQWYAEYLLSMGRFNESYRMLEKAQKLDPKSLAVIANFATYYFLQKDYDKVIEIGNELIVKEPKFPWGHLALSIGYYHKNMRDKYVEAEAKTAKIFKGVEDKNIKELKDTYKENGWKAYWEKRIEQMNEEPDSKTYSAYDYVICYIALEKKDLAVDYYEKVYEERDRWIVYAKYEPMLEPIRSEPRFQEIVKRVGL